MLLIRALEYDWKRMNQLWELCPEEQVSLVQFLKFLQMMNMMMSSMHLVNEIRMFLKLAQCLKEGLIN